MRYDTLLLDLDGTLLDFHKSQAATFFDCFPGASPELYEQFETINRAQWARLERGEASREEILHERFALFLREANLPGDPDEMNRRYLDRLACGCDVIDSAPETVRELSDRCTLAIVTNGASSVQRRRLRESGLLPFFKTVVISEEVGVTKPDPRLFKIAMENCSVKDPAKVLVVGDSLTADIAGGYAAGLDTCWMNTEGLPVPQDCPAAWVIRRPSQLIAIVSGKEA